MLSKKNLTFEENKPLRASVAPLYSPEIDCCFFLTNIKTDSSNQQVELMEATKRAVQQIFEVLVEGKKALLVDISDLEAGDKVFNLEHAIDRLVDSTNKTKQASLSETQEQ